METFSVLLDLCAGNSPVAGEFPAQRPVTRSFDVFFDLRLNKLLSKQSWGWWFETSSRPLWSHCNALNLPCAMWIHPETIMRTREDIVNIAHMAWNLPETLTLIAFKYVMKPASTLWSISMFICNLTDVGLVLLICLYLSSKTSCFIKM